MQSGVYSERPDQLFEPPAPAGCATPGLQQSLLRLELVQPAAGNGVEGLRGEVSLATQRVLGAGEQGSGRGTPVSAVRRRPVSL